MFILLPSPSSMHLVIYVGQVACAANISMLLLPGSMVDHDMTLFLSMLMNFSKECLNVACTRLFFSVTMNHVKYPCTLVHWYTIVRDSPDDNTSGAA